MFLHVLLTQKENILCYDIGKSKTGSIASFKRTLVINNYGIGEKEQEKLQNDHKRYLRDKNSISKLLYDDNKKPIGICGQAPSDYPELAQFLIDHGIDSISLNPDVILRF